MSIDVKRPNRPVTARLHPLIYRTILGLAALLTVSVWSFAGGNGTGLPIAVAVGFILVAVTVPWKLSQILRRGGRGAALRRRRSFREWLSGDFETLFGRMKAPDAAVEILLPVAAVAFGMAAFSIVLHLTLDGVI